MIENRKGNGMKKIDLKKTDDDHSQMAGHYMYLFYGDAKQAGIRQGDIVTITSDGNDLKGTYKVDQYIDWRNDINRPFKGFRLVAIEKE